VRFLCLTALLRIAEQSAGRIDQDDLPAILKARSKKSPCACQGSVSEQPDDQERPCLHCIMVELIDEIFPEYPAAGGEPDT
jgi:hypothetical protein